MPVNQPPPPVPEFKPTKADEKPVSREFFGDDDFFPASLPGAASIPSIPIPTSTPTPTKDGKVYDPDVFLEASASIPQPDSTLSFVGPVTTSQAKIPVTATSSPPDSQPPPIPQSFQSSQASLAPQPGALPNPVISPGAASSSNLGQQPGSAAASVAASGAASGPASASGSPAVIQPASPLPPSQAASPPPPAPPASAVLPPSVPLPAPNPAAASQPAALLPSGGVQPPVASPSPPPAPAIPSAPTPPPVTAKKTNEFVQKKLGISASFDKQMGVISLTTDKTLRESKEKIEKTQGSLKSFNLSNVKQQVEAAITEARTTVVNAEASIKSLETSCSELAKTIGEEKKKSQPDSAKIKGFEEKLKSEQDQLRLSKQKLLEKKSAVALVEKLGQGVIEEKEKLVRTDLISGKLLEGFDAKLKILYDQSFAIENPNQKVDDILKNVKADLSEAEALYKSANETVEKLKKECTHIEEKTKDHTKLLPGEHAMTLAAQLKAKKDELAQLEPILAAAKTELDKLQSSAAQSKELLEVKKSFAEASKSGIPPSALLLSDGIRVFNKNFGNTNNPARIKGELETDAKGMVLFKKHQHGKKTFYVATANYTMKASGKAPYPGKELKFSRSIIIETNSSGEAGSKAAMLMHHFLDLAQEEARADPDKKFKSPEEKAYRDQLMDARIGVSIGLPIFHLILKQGLFL